MRKNVARVLTVLNQKAKADMRKQIAGRKYKPKALRVKKTRALRRALKPSEVRRCALAAAGAAARLLCARCVGDGTGARTRRGVCCG